MKKIMSLLVSILFLLGILFSGGCKKDISIAVLTTNTLTNITVNSGTSGGVIKNNGGAEITARGVCWSTSQNPTISDSFTSDGKGNGSFTSDIIDLVPSTKYFVKAYATNSAGTAYGNELSFTTSDIVVPLLTTTAITSITLTSAVSGGEITNSGGADITARGICWSTSANPTIDDDKTNIGTGIGAFSGNISGLLPGTLYYVRSFATNSAGTGYGNEISFTTTAQALPTLSTITVTAVTITSAVSGGEITNNGGANITVRGVCWSTSANPTIDDDKTENGTGSGSFASDITSLVPGTLYHVRAYATNSVGTAYGNDLTFTTVAVVLPVLTTTPVTLITTSSAMSGGEISSAGGGNISQKGVCWAINANPTISNSHTTNGPGTGSFTSSITSLIYGTVYHVRAYATNEAGTAYGDDITFTTVAVVLPTVTTTSISAVTATAAQSGGNVTNAGGGTISARGVCWSTSTDPNIDDDPHTSNATGTGNFTSTIINLTGDETYYVKAYATNEAGTSYGAERSFTTPAATDADGNNYSSVTIGTQTWLKENLKTTRYRNGDLIGTTNPVTLDITTAVSPKYQWPVGGLESNVSTYGRFYTWFAATDSRELCPTGWHLPSDNELEALKTFLGGSSVAGGKVKEVGLAHWQTPNTGATDEVGFTALPGGYRAINGAFVSLTITGYFWSSTTHQTNVDWSWGQGLHYNDAIMLRGGYFKNDGASVRCLKD